MKKPIFVSPLCHLTGALVTEAMTRQIRKQTGVPIVTITYDGTSEAMNDALVPYIQKKKVVL